MSLNIKENAVFIADSHYNDKRNELLVFLQKLDSSSIQVEQIFFMGDMFDFLTSETSYFISKNKEVINLVNKLSKKYDIVYLEGNHDFNIQNLFPNIRVYTRDKQPLYAKYKNKTVALSHGDIYIEDIFYDMYCSIIRSNSFLSMLTFVDYKNIISKKTYKALLNKNICHLISNFKELVSKRLKYYNTDIIIEGHFHQGNEYLINNKRYKNIPSLTCSKQYTVLRDNNFIDIDMDIKIKRICNSKI